MTLSDGHTLETRTGLAAEAESARASARTRRLRTATNVARAMRPQQWVKNLLLFAPLVLAHRVDDLERLAAVFVGFVCFSMCASAGYVVNDLHDRNADRHHPAKRRRPFASGALGPASGVVLIMVLVLAGFGISSVLLPAAFTAMLGAYLILSAAYTSWIKTKVVVDVSLLAGLYTIRPLAGAAVAGVEVSAWFLGLSSCMFVSLALAKRHAELARVRGEAGTSIRGRAYRTKHLSALLNAGRISGYLGVGVLALYISTNPEPYLYERQYLLWLICPVLFVWVTRVWRIAGRGALSEDPVVWASTDRVSLVTIGFMTLVFLLASVELPAA